MTTLLADAPRADRIAWLAFHGPQIAQARANWEAQTEVYAALLASCQGAFESSRASASEFAEDVIGRADAKLAEELRQYLNV